MLGGVYTGMFVAIARSGYLKRYEIFFEIVWQRDLTLCEQAFDKKRRPVEKNKLSSVFAKQNIFSAL
jgi:hypothetical protein